MDAYGGACHFNLSRVHVISTLCCFLCNHEFVVMIDNNLPLIMNHTLFFLCYYSWEEMQGGTDNWLQIVMDQLFLMPSFNLTLHICVLCYQIFDTELFHSYLDACHLSIWEIFPCWCTDWNHEHLRSQSDYWMPPVWCRVLEIMQTDAQNDPAVFPNAIHARQLVNQVSSFIAQQNVVPNFTRITKAR